MWGRMRHRPVRIFWNLQAWYILNLSSLQTAAAGSLVLVLKEQWGCEWSPGFWNPGSFLHSSIRPGSRKLLFLIFEDKSLLPWSYPSQLQSSLS